MTRDEAVARIQQGLGFRTDKTAEIVLALQEAQRLLENGRTLPYFLVQEDETLTAPAGTAAISLPTGFIRERDDELDETLRYYDSDALDWVFLEKLDLLVAIDRFNNVDAGTPQAYVLRTNSVLVYPERDISYDLTWSYYKRGTLLDSDIENAWLEEAYGAPEALIGRAGMIMARDLRDDKAFTVFQEMHVTAWAGAISAGITRQEANRKVYVGGRL